MARKPRIHFPGAIYHVICRGNNKEPVFATDTEKQSYLGLMKEYKERYPFKLYAWAILSNHAHLLIEVEKDPLSKLMQGIQQSYTGRYNHYHKRTGHVFEQRYKAFLCKREKHLLDLVHYIHYNPARAGLPAGINNPYCSHRDYIWGSTHGLTDTEYPLSLFAHDRTTAVMFYRQFMDEEKNSPSSLPQALRSGGKEYVPGLVEREQDKVDVSISKLIPICAEIAGVDASQLTKRCRRRELVTARWILVQFCLPYTNASQRELATVLGVSVAAVSKAGRSVSNEVSEGVGELWKIVENKA